MTMRRLFAFGVLTIGLVGVALVGRGALDRLSVPPWSYAQGDDTSAQVGGGTRVGQSFAIPFTSLHRIEIRAAGIPTTDRAPYTFHLSPASSANSDPHVAWFDVLAPLTEGRVDLFGTRGLYIVTAMVCFIGLSYLLVFVARRMPDDLKGVA